MMSADERREVREIGLELIDVFRAENRKDLATEIELHYLKCQGAQKDVDAQIAAHCAACGTAKLVSNTVQQAKGATWVVRTAWVIVGFIVAVFGGVFGSKIGGH